MNPDFSTTASGENTSKSGRFESIAYYVFLATLFLAPLSFWPSPYIALDLVKTIVIVMGSLLSSIMIGMVFLKEKRIVLPPKSILSTSILLVVSMLVSALLSIHPAKSLFGQGFEFGTASFLVAVFISAFVAFTLVFRKNERSVLFYAALTAVFIVIFVYQILRLLAGSDFMSLSIMNSVTSTFLGNWTSFGIFAALIGIISFVAVTFLPLTRKLKISYWILVGMSGVAVAVVNSAIIWQVLSLIFVGFVFYTAAIRKSENPSSSWFKKIALVPVLLLVVSVLFSWKGSYIVSPTLNKLNANSNEISLPWQMSLDVISGVVKNYPTFGVGPNHFSKAYLAYKPDAANTGEGWGLEFSAAFGFIPTFIASQGLLGLILWILFLVFMGIVGTKTLRKLPQDPSQRFTLISSFTGTAFLWILMLVGVPSHPIIFLAFVFAGIFLGTSASYGLVQVPEFKPSAGSRTYKAVPVIAIALIVVAGIWGIVHLKKAAALAYFASGVKQLNISGDPDLAEKYFNKALALDKSDIYWQAKVEASLGKISLLASSLNDKTPASTSQAISEQIVATMNKASEDANKAIEYDKSYYYNYLSQARVYEVADSLGIKTGYESALKAYGSAIGLNPKNPSLYLSLARMQAKDEKYDEALQTIGASLQVKNNYLDAIFLLSQVSAAKGNLSQAISAAQYAIQLNPQNPLLYFQLGLLNFNAKSYSPAAEALAKAVSLQPDYANAQYFLGLSYARLGKTADAISQFKNLAKSNPDNQEIALILDKLETGKPLFTDMQSSAATPEKRASLPIKSKK